MTASGDPVGVVVTSPRYPTNYRPGMARRTGREGWQVVGVAHGASKPTVIRSLAAGSGACRQVVES